MSRQLSGMGCGASGYLRFVESVLDYREKSDIEAISVLSALAERIKNKT